ncbi:MAG: ribonuclease R [Bacteroidia bacterium]|nr:ribonuclease R [Bacteroidia bacterium]
MAKSKSPKTIEKENKRLRSLRTLVVQFLQKEPHKAFNHKQIAAGCGLKGELSTERMIEFLDQMAEAGLLKVPERGKYSVVVKERVQTGRVEIKGEGYGFVVLDTEEKTEDVFVPPNRLNKAMNGDKVQVRITKGGGRGQRAEGEIVEVLERATEAFIGTIELIGKTPTFRPDDPKLNQDFVVTVAKDLVVRDGDKVIIKLGDWTHHLPEGEVIKVLGKSGENETEMHAILFQFGFEVAFPPEVEAEVAKFDGKILDEEIAKRRDMRKITTFTIDPHDAKDFDDALSFERLSNGNIEVGVHIADVSHFVHPGTALDDEAYNRATSVYLVDRTVPMLPERLSNDLCSLRPHEDRLCFSAIFEVDEHGNLIKEWFGRTIIHSDRRFAYEEAQDVMDKGEGDYFEELTELNRLAKIFQKERFKHGSINFEEDEVKFELDAEGKPIRVYRKVRKDAHKMIEDWMLMANKRVTFHVAKMRQGIPLPFLYRIHDRPDEEKLYTLQQFAATLGYNLDLSDERKIAKALNALMTQVEGKPEQSMLQTVAVRTMAKAIYSTDNIGHYGLGFEHYTHFTSPIRRYPDLIVHRLLGQYLSGNFNANPGKLELAAKHTSNREKRAAEAERASIKYKQVEFLEDKIGVQFEGIVTGVTNWGVYVEILENRCEGMIGLHTMTDDYYEVDTTNYCIRGRLSGRKISLGDKLMVEVKGTSLRNRTIDFLMIAHLESAFEDTEMPLVQRRAAQAPGGKGQYGGRRGGMPMKKHGPAGGEKRKAKKGTSKGANKGKPKRRG